MLVLSPHEEEIETDIKRELQHGLDPERKKRYLKAELEAEEIGEEAYVRLLALLGAEIGA